MDESFIIKNYIDKLLDEQTSDDDVAFLNLSNSNYIITSDTLNEDIHFLDKDPAKSISYRLLNASLSDIFAKGSTPLYVILNLSFKKSLAKSWYEEFFSEIVSQKNKYNFKVIGGDTCLGKNNSFSVTIIAKSYKNYPKRSNISENEDIFVTNNIGSSYLGLQEKLTNKTNYYYQNYLFPVSTFNYVNLIKKYAVASTDLSDGLYSGLENLANSSQLFYEIDFKKIPFIDKKHQIEQFCYSDDYQILFTAKSNNYSEIISYCSKNALKITKIGKFNKDNNIIKNLSHIDKNKLKKFFHKF